MLDVICVNWHKLPVKLKVCMGQLGEGFVSMDNFIIGDFKFVQ